jgi:hypothetical protein
VFLEQDIQNMTFANFDDSSTPRDLLCPFAGDKDEKDEEKLGDSTADMFFAGDGLKDLANDPEIAGDKDEKDEEKLGDSTADMFKKCFGLKNLANDPEIDEFGDFAQAPKMEYLAQSAASKMEEPKVLKKELLEKDNLDDTAKLFDDLCEEEKGEKVVLNDTFGNEHTYRRIVDKANPIDPRNPAKGKPAEATDDDGTKVGIATDGIILSEVCLALIYMMNFEWCFLSEF